MQALQKGRSDSENLQSLTYVFLLFYYSFHEYSKSGIAIDLSVTIKELVITQLGLTLPKIVLYLCSSTTPCHSCNICDSATFHCTGSNLTGPLYLRT